MNDNLVPVTATHSDTLVSVPPISGADDEMRVVKRNGNLEEVAFDKILQRIKKIGHECDIKTSINYSALSIKVIDQLYDCIPTSKLDELMAEQCASMSATHPDYAVLAARITISNHHKNTLPSFHETMSKLFHTKDKFDATKPAPIISAALWETVKQYEKELEACIDYSRDYLMDYFGFKTMEKSYLFKISGTVVERPQHMWMRVSIGIHGDDLERVKETYYYLSNKYFTHATPTLFNAGTSNPQLSSCFLVAMEEDSIDGIYDTLKDCAKISKYSGGIGISVSNIRSNGSLIKGNNGSSNGIVPMLRVFNETARYVNQGNRRPGSIAIYLEPWHADVFEFLDMKKNQGDENAKARDLFYALWISDLFMERVVADESWSLFCPNDCPGLVETHSDAFRTLYLQYEKQGRAKRTVEARTLWIKMLESQMETGTPYFLYKDACNAKSNQQNLGTIRSSNLCTEIVEYSDKNETAVCNLASIALPAYVNTETKEFDYEALHKMVKIVTLNLNRIIDINFYPTEKARRSNMRHRPIGIGVQGLADAFILMNIAFHSEAAAEVNRLIFETMYHAALEKSCEMAQDNGAYETFQGSPASKGQLQFDLWESSASSTKSSATTTNKSGKKLCSSRYTWTKLKKLIVKHGLRNSLLIAPMPTASTSQLLGYNECFEPFTSNIYVRRTLAGEFVMVNKYLIRELIELGVWDEKMKNSIIEHRGSVQHLMELPEHVRNKYKIVWEIPSKHIIDMAADRGVFICQSQSMNLWRDNPDYRTLGNMHIYAWKKGLKTGIYYLRRKAAHSAQQFTIEPDAAAAASATAGKEQEQSEEICEMCSA
jgi:ribonucleoside-diphosphate reductase alpha subunit